MQSTTYSNGRPRKAVLIKQTEVMALERSTANKRTPNSDLHPAYHPTPNSSWQAICNRLLLITLEVLATNGAQGRSRKIRTKPTIAWWSKTVLLIL